MSTHITNWAPLSSPRALEVLLLPLADFWNAKRSPRFIKLSIWARSCSVSKCWDLTQLVQEALSELERGSEVSIFPSSPDNHLSKGEGAHLVALDPILNSELP